MDDVRKRKRRIGDGMKLQVGCQRIRYGSDELRDKRCRILEAEAVRQLLKPCSIGPHRLAGQLAKGVELGK